MSCMFGRSNTREKKTELPTNDIINFTYLFTVANVIVINILKNSSVKLVARLI